MKRIVLPIALVVVLLSTPLFGRAAVEAQQLTIRMAAMQGPSGFGTVGLQRDGGAIGQNTVVELSVYPSPNEVIARLVNGELDAAALPTNVAANLWAKGVGIKTAAVIGEGMLMFLSTDDTITELSDLQGRRIYVPGAGSTPDQMANILLMALGFDAETDIIYDYSVAAPAQLAQMLIANRVDLAILPEPFVTMVKAANPRVFPLIDVQQLWSALTGTGNYPMTVFVVSDAFVAAHKEKVPLLMEALSNSINWVNANPSEAGAMIEEAGIMNAQMATPAISKSNLVFRSAKEAYEAMDIYLKVLYGFDYSSIGGEVPDASFYLSY
jgi:NitT/TauT family transport system substrate-binding protein